MRIKYFLICIAFLIPLSSKAAAKTSMSRSQYIGGGVVGTVVGLGLGHAIQGRYSETGWKYTAIETGFIIGGMVGGSAVAARADRTVGGVLFAFGLGGYLVTRVFEAVDVWSPDASVTLMPVHMGGQIAFTYRF